MPQEAALSHRNVRTANIPYVSNMSPTETSPCYVPGAQNLLTGIAGFSERRPGFSDSVEPVPTVFNNLQRKFTWDRTDGTFYVMFCDIAANGNSLVYKMQIGMDNSAVLIWTDVNSSTPYDFVVSNNTVYFSNGTAAKKWDPQNGISNWGIAIGSVNNITGPNTAGAGSNVFGSGGSVVWTNPGNVTSSVSFATTTLSAAGGFFVSDLLYAQTFGFTIPATSMILGIQATFAAKKSVTNTNPVDLHVIIIKGGVITGTVKFQKISTTLATYTFGGTGDLWGTTWTFNDINQTSFGVSVQAYDASGTPCTYSVDNVQITIFSLGGPTVTVSGSAGTMSAVTGYQYVFCYGNSNTGHVSSPTPPSASTGAFTSKLNVQVALTASTDPQVNQIRVFRSTDSVAVGTTAAVYFELPTSPYPNTTANILDNAADTALIVANVAPTATFNDPPTPGQSAVYFAGRIWMFTGNKVWFSGLEETLLGVPEESWPSGIAGNFWAFDQPVTGLKVAGSGTNQTLLIYCGGRLYGITGMTLDTFQRVLISARRGCRNLTCISELGGMVAWLDSAGQVWATDGTSLQEIGIQIRPDTKNLAPASCSMSFHSQGIFHWLVLSTGTQLFVYDIDMQQWMPPWTFACQYLFSGEVSPGNYKLMAAVPSKALQMGTVHNDNGAAYSPVWRTSLFSMVPDFGTRFSYIAAGLYDEPSRTGMPWYFQIDTNNHPLKDVQFTMDDDPLNASTVYSSIMSQQQDVSVAFNRNNGNNLLQNVWVMTQPYSRWIGWQFTGTTADDDLRVYGFYTAYQVKR